MPERLWENRDLKKDFAFFIKHPDAYKQFMMNRRRNMSHHLKPKPPTEYKPPEKPVDVKMPTENKYNKKVSEAVY